MQPLYVFLSICLELEGHFAQANCRSSGRKKVRIFVSSVRHLHKLHIVPVFDNHNAELHCVSMTEGQKIKQ